MGFCRCYNGHYNQVYIGYRRCPTYLMFRHCSRLLADRCSSAVRPLLDPSLGYRKPSSVTGPPIKALDRERIVKRCLLAIVSRVLCPLAALTSSPPMVLFGTAYKKGSVFCVCLSLCSCQRTTYHGGCKI